MYLPNPPCSTSLTAWPNETTEIPRPTSLTGTVPSKNWTNAGSVQYLNPHTDVRGSLLANTIPTCSPFQLYTVDFLTGPRATMDIRSDYPISRGTSLRPSSIFSHRFRRVRYFSKYKFRAFLLPSTQAIRLWPSSLESWFNMAYKYCHWSSVVCLSTTSQPLWGGSGPLGSSSHEKKNTAK